MFGLFKKKHNYRSADKEIDSLALMVFEEGDKFSKRVVGNLKIIEKENSQPMLYSEYIKSCKINFEFTWFLFEDIRRQFILKGYENIGNYVCQHMGEILLKAHAHMYISFLENNEAEIINILRNSFIEKTSSNSKLYMYAEEAKGIERRNTVSYKVVLKVCRIIKDILDDEASASEFIDIVEMMEVQKLFYQSALQDQFTLGISKIIDRLNA